MAVMDIAAIFPLFQGVYDLLSEGGIFVFSTYHPCFMKPPDVYMTPAISERERIRRQSVKQLYYHRSLQDLFHTILVTGFVIDGFYEETDDDPEMPVIIIVRVRKPGTIS